MKMRLPAVIDEFKVGPRKKEDILRHILFKRHVSLKSVTKEDRPRPTGHILTEDWQRAVGLPDFNMLKGE